MPVTKNAFIRYKYLDELLSDYHHNYDINDLTERKQYKKNLFAFDLIRILYLL